MIRQVIGAIHLVLALAVFLAVLWGALNGDEHVWPFLVPVGLLAGVAWGVWEKSRWMTAGFAVPAALLAFAVGGIVTIGNIAWPERTVNTILLATLAFLLLELGTTAWAMATFPKRGRAGIK